MEKTLSTIFMLSLPLILPACELMINDMPIDEIKRTIREDKTGWSCHSNYAAPDEIQRHYDNRDIGNIK
jgi:hypothetical protein